MLIYVGFYVLVGNDQPLYFLKEGPGDPVIGKRYFLKLTLKQ